MKKTSLILLLAMAAAGTTHAQQQTEAEAKLREGLRATTLQLRTVQAEADELRIAKERLEADHAALTQKMESMLKQAVSDQEAYEASKTEMNQMIARQDGEIVRLNTTLGKWKAAYEKAAQVANEKESARASMQARAIQMERKAEDYARKNAELHRLGQEILSRYERFGLGTAITAREPFIGTTRVKLQNLVQDYSDKLSEQTITN